MQNSQEIIPCSECPLIGCQGLAAPEKAQLEFLDGFKIGEILVERGGAIFKQGGKSPHLHTVLEGVLMRYRTLDDGRRQIVNFMFPGDLVGLQAAFDDQSSHGVEALTDSKLCVFPRDGFVRLIGSHPRLGYDLIWLGAKEETELEEHLVALGQRSAKERVAYLAVWLLERALATGLADDHNMVKLSIRQNQIADMLGLSLVHTNRTIKSLGREELVHWERGEICVPDMEKTAEFAQYEYQRGEKRPYI